MVRQRRTNTKMSRFDPEIITYCDINKCEDCPRYGDDCDGKGGEEDDDI